jgi:cation diffusion facilitator family transporter
VASESKTTVLVALAANALIALAKLVAAIISGSSALFAETAHSVADTLNQVFLLISIEMSERPADPDHPFGHGKARFLWSFVAAVGIFVAGALFSVYEGVHTLLHGGESTGLRVAYAVLAVSLLAEGTSWLRALSQVRSEARAAGRSLFRYIRESRDPTVKTVLSEDTAAVLGILLAAVGIGLHHVTGSAVWDGAAAIAIGLVLAVVAFVLGRDTQDLLIGEGADPELVIGIYDLLSERPEVEQVVELLTMYLGPTSLLVAARVDLRDLLTAAQVEEFSGRVDRDLVRRWPEVQQVFLDATRADRALAERTRRHIEQLKQKTAAPD